MSNQSTLPSVEHSFENVNPQYDTQLPLFSDSMIHHKVSSPRRKRIIYYRDQCIHNTYGVSRSRRILSPQLLLKRFDQVIDCLVDTVGLTRAQCEVTSRLLRYFAYYGKVYPKQSQLVSDNQTPPVPRTMEDWQRFSSKKTAPGCSKATFWRTVKVLESLGLITVINRYLIRPHAQISNLYRLDRLLLVIARYLAEHGTAFLEDWLRPYLTMPGHQFWPWMLFSTGPSPGSPALCNT